MLTISKPLSAGQAQSYHAEEFGNARENYYTETDQIRGKWHGRLAEQWGLRGEVHEEHFQRLSEGQHPITGEQLIRRQAAREYMNRRGEKVSAMEHRAGWDATFSAPKSVSLSALVGGDERVRGAHRESVGVALDELERYVQARIGGNLPAETTGKWIAAKFEHDSARPVDGYAAPQLHTHVVLFNLTETDDGEAHALQPRELYKTQQYATAVYRSELAHRLKELGYEIERGESSQPEIKGYSKEYLQASSPRRQQIQEHLAKENQRGAGAAQIAAHQTREGKLALSHVEMQQRHREMAATFGNQPERVVEVAQERREQLKEEPGEKAIGQALTYSREKNLEREAVAEERELLRDALKRSMGDATVAEVKAEFEKRVQAGEFIETSNRAPGRAFTTEEMIDYERNTIHAMRAGQNQHAPIASFETRRKIEQDHSHLSGSQRAAVEQILSSHDRVGDTRQHEAIEAGRPYQQLQESGIETARLDEIVRQKDPALREVVEQLSRGQVRDAMEKLEAQGCVHEIPDRGERLKEIAREYATKPEGTLVVSPDNQSRREINEAIHRTMQSAGHVETREHKQRVLVARQEITGADRQWAAQYEVGDVVRYTRGSKTHGIKAGEYSRVERANEKENLVTVKRENGERVRYDPRRLHGVTLYRETERAFSEGDRVQFTAPNREQHIANRELGTIEKIDDSGNLQLRLDSGRDVAFNIKDNPHLDYGYAVTSHSSQGQTADRVLVHVDTEQSGEKLVNRRLAYVAVSRGRYDAQIYTNHKSYLTEQLSRDVSHRSAMEPNHESLSSAHETKRSSASSQAHEHMQAEGQSISR
jgi:conjugative relaxase-like TrwC/TraI family protein